MTSTHGLGFPLAQLVHRQDPVTELMQVFDTVFRLVMPGPGRGIVGFKGISEKLRGAPGWYLWFEDRPGAYLLELVEAENIAETVNGRSGARGTFWIKYYPAVDDLRSFNALAGNERAIRTGGAFDDTGTPDFDRGCDIPEASFLIGAIEATLAADGDRFSLHMEAPDRWLSFITEQNGAGAAGKAGRDRDLPAWDWSWFLLDRLILTLCLGYGTVPRRVSLNEEPGHSFHLETDGTTLAVRDDRIRGRRLRASFSISGDNSEACCPCHAHQHAGGVDSREDSPGRLLFTCEREPSEGHPWVSPRWWHIRESHADLGGALPC